MPRHDVMRRFRYVIFLPPPADAADAHIDITQWSRRRFLMLFLSRCRHLSFTPRQIRDADIADAASLCLFDEFRQRAFRCRVADAVEAIAACRRLRFYAA